MPIILRVKTYFCTNISCPFKLTADQTRDPYSAYYLEKWKGISPGKCASCFLKGNTSDMALDLSNERNIVGISTNDDLDNFLVDELDENYNPVMIPTGEYQNKIVHKAGVPVIEPIEKYEVKQRELTRSEKLEYREKRDSELRRVENIVVEELDELPE